MNTAPAVDLVIEARWMVPVDPPGVVLENHALVVNHGRIIDLLPQSELAGRFSPRSRKCLDQHVLIPGLVNLHTHAAMTCCVVSPMICR
jgi:5-methylthioadenosine/S-adenosylhomocysteine deaminase